MNSGLYSDMRWLMFAKKAIFLVTILCMAYFFLHIKSNDSVTLTEVQYCDMHRIFDGKPRLLDVAVWYPSREFCQHKKLPLILFSHGYAGSPYGSSWFAEHLAKHGYIVASVKHYGNSYDNKILAISVRPWNRPQDMSFVLDQMLQDPIFKDHIDQKRIGAAGFSQGGMTSLWLAGVRANLSVEMLHKHISTIKNDPDWQSVHENFTLHDFSQANQSYRDERIKAVFAMAPGIDFDNWMFTQEGFSFVTIPVQIVAAEQDQDVSVEEHARFFAQHMPSSNLVILPEVTHWIFMNVKDLQNKESEKHAAVHKHVGAMAVEFFEKNL